MIRYEKEINDLKQKLSHELAYNRILSDEVSKLQRFKVHLEAVNDVLIKANKKHEEKSQKNFYTMEFYKDFYRKYMDLITKGTSNHQKRFNTVLITDIERSKNINEKLFMAKETSPEYLAQALKKANAEIKNVGNTSLQLAKEEAENEEEINKLKIQSNDNVFGFTKEQSKIFLLNLAKDLFISNKMAHPGIKSRRALKDESPKGTNTDILRLQRSTSNPLEYISEKEKVVFEPRVTNKEKIITPAKKESNVKFFDDQNEIIVRSNRKRMSTKLGLEVATTARSIKEIKNDDIKKVVTNESPGLKKLVWDEPISFTVDMEDFNKKNLVECSFISNTDILEQIKH